MNILQILKQLRDDIKAWVTINLNALNAKIDEKTIPIDSELDENSTNPVQNKTIATEIADINKRVGNTSVATQISNAVASIPKFSGDYNDLINAPDIEEDDNGNIVIADELGNVVFKVDANGAHTTDLSLNGKPAATEEYVDNIISNIEIPEVDFTGYATEEFVTQIISATKTELSETMASENDSWTIADSEGNIIFIVDAEGVKTTAVTLNGESAATESYVDDAIANIEFPTTDLTGYATEQWVENKNYLTEHQDISGKSDVGHKHVIADITDMPDYATKKYVDDAVDNIEIPEVDFTGYATETYVDNKVADLVNSAPEALNTLGELATALENHEDAYDALLETVGGKATKTELEDMKSELSESIVSETDEFHIVDDAGNIVASIDENGIATTTVTAQSIVVNGDNVEEHLDNANIHVTAAEKETWNNKSNFSGSYNDLTDKPVPTDLSNYYTKTEVDAAIENVDVDLTGYATEEYVTNAINGIDIPETDLTNYYTKTETDTAIESAKDELSESIVSESEEWHIVDNNGNIVATIDASGISTTTVAAQAITLNGEVIDLSNYYTKADIDAKLGDIEAALDAILEMQESLLPPATISFVIEWVGDTYNFEAIEGMTWREWCNSEYNTAELYITEDNMVYIGVSGIVCDGHWQTPDDVIVANATYVA